MMTEGTKNRILIGLIIAVVLLMLVVSLLLNKNYQLEQKNNQQKNEIVGYKNNPPFCGFNASWGNYSIPCYCDIHYANYTLTKI